MKELTVDLLRELLEYNPETGIFTWRFRPDCPPNWNGRFVGKTAGHMATDGYCRIMINRRLYLVHRLAWLYVHGEWPAGDIDHINHNPADNRLVNFRVVARGENQKNQSRYKTNTSGITGICWNSARQRWQATIMDNGKTKNLGRFNSIEDAIKARKAAELSLGFHENHGRAA